MDVVSQDKKFSLILMQSVMIFKSYRVLKKRDFCTECFGHALKL